MICATRALSSLSRARPNRPTFSSYATRSNAERLARNLSGLNIPNPLVFPLGSQLAGDQFQASGGGFDPPECSGPLRGFDVGLARRGHIKVRTVEDAVGSVLAQVNLGEHRTV